MDNLRGTDDIATVVQVTLSGKADEVLRRIEKDAQRTYLPIMGRDRGRVLAEIVRKTKPKRILEVGTLVGYSTIIIAREIGADAEIVTIEIDEEVAEIARKNIEEAEIKPRVEVLIGDALQVIPKVNGKFDMVFLDADKGEYLDCLRLVEDKLRSGSVIVADNAGAYAYSMRRYLDYVRKSGRYESQFMPVGRDGLEVSTKL